MNRLFTSSEKIFRFLKSLLHKIPSTAYAALAFFLALGIGVLAGSSSSKLVHSSHVKEILSTSDSWGLSFQKEGERPIGNSSIEDLAPYHAYFAKNTDEKILYLTFDAGYENGNTPAILEALNKHQAPATFFVVGTFIERNPELVRQMCAEGHIVGNHTMTHPDMSGISTMDAFQKELDDVSERYRDATGEEMIRFYRPPQGIYSTNNLTMAKELGYHTFFWSLAYVDWNQNRQPTKEEAFDKLLKRIHPGAIVLLHSTSSTNAQILDELLTKWEEMGYHFGSLKDFVEKET